MCIVYFPGTVRCIALGTWQTIMKSLIPHVSLYLGDYCMTHGDATVASSDPDDSVLLPIMRYFTDAQEDYSLQSTQSVTSAAATNPPGPPENLYLQNIMLL